MLPHGHCGPILIVITTTLSQTSTSKATQHRSLRSATDRLLCELMDSLARGAIPCTCPISDSAPLRLALTGGPGAGKTAVLQLAQRSLCSHVVLVPESAGIVFGGGFPRLASMNARKAVQRAIFHVQRELEAIAATQEHTSLILFDRGTLDGVAYWPESTDTFWQELGISREQELLRYDAVIHMRTPSLLQGYNHDNRLRVESNDEAIGLDHKIEDAWQGHPNRVTIESQASFVQKAIEAITGISRYLPPGCAQTSSRQLNVS